MLLLSAAVLFVVSPAVRACPAHEAALQTVHETTSAPEALSAIASDDCTASRRRGCPRRIPPCFLRRSLGQRPSAAVPRIPASSVISRYPLREADFRFSSLCFFLIRRLWKPSDRGLSAFYSEIPQNGNDSLHGTHDGFLVPFGSFYHPRRKTRSFRRGI